MTPRLVHALPRSDELRARLERMRERVRLLDIALDAFEEDADIGGGILAGALAYRLFLFLLPLAFLLVAALGLLSDAVGSTPTGVARDLGLIGVVSHEVATTADGSSGVWVAFVALVVLAYATRVLFRSVGIVHSLAWEHSAASAKSGSRSLRLFALGLLTQVGLSAAASATHLHTLTETVVEWIALAVAIGSVWLGVSLLLPHSTARWRNLVPGAVFYGVGILAVHAFDIYVLEFVQRSRSNTYGTLGAATTILLSLFFVGRLVVGAAVLNAVLFARRAASEAADDV